MNSAMRNITKRSYGHKNLTLALVSAVTLVSGCSFWQSDKYESESPTLRATLSDLDLAKTHSNATLSHSAPSLDQITVSELIARIEQVKKNSPIKQAFPIASRLAQLQLKRMDDQLAEGEADFDSPLSSLNELIELAPDDVQKAELYYQKARVEEVSGNLAPVIESLTALIDSETNGSEQDDLTTQSALKLEAHFRRAERYFSDERYQEAEQDFALVAEVAGEYQLHARYMLCWVRFKRGDLEGSLEASAQAMAQLADDDRSRYEVLQQDLLRVTVVALDYLDGPQTLAAMMRTYEKPVWQTRLYESLGSWYLSKSRFADSAATWKTFLIENPMHESAPEISLAVMTTQRQAGFVADIPQLEDEFIQRYGKQAEFYSVHGDAVFARYETQLKTMLDRFTHRLHSAALEDAVQDEIEESVMTEQGTLRRQARFSAAAAAYRLWLINFAQDVDAQQKRFLYAEVLQQADGFPAAQEQFEQVIAMDATTDFAVEAAYAVVLGVENLGVENLGVENLGVEKLGVDSPGGESLDNIVAANLRFASLFPSDERAAVCQLNAANQLFKLSRYEQALKEGLSALAFEQTPNNLIIAKKLVAHSAFERSDFELAQVYYSQLTQLEPSQAITEKLLATVFRLGQQAEAAGDMQGATEQFERLYQIDPNSKLARDASFDLAALYEAQGELRLAIDQLETFRQRYPTDEQSLGDEIALRLVALKESEGDLLGAANELLVLSGSSEGEVSRTARYRAAELFLQRGDIDQAIEHFRYYAHQYPEPINLRFEAMHHMDALYAYTNDETKRRYWLRKKRDIFDTLRQADKTDRNRFLAASARWELTREGFDEYKRAKLTLPLAKSLKHKQQLLARNLDNLNKIASIGVFEFVTKSQHEKGVLYEILAQDLIAAEQPKNLNALEQEQYLLLLEEQAYPFEEKAIELHQQNLQLGWELGWNASVEHSLAALQKFSPARFKRAEQEVAYVVTAR